jgi:hypothetical protein
MLWRIVLAHESLVLENEGQNVPKLAGGDIFLASVGVIRILRITCQLWRPSTT